MAAITSADILYTQQSANMILPGRVTRLYKLTFPTGGTNNQCPAAGVPLDKAKLGCPRELVSLTILGADTSADNDATVAQPIYNWNGSRTAPTLLAYNIPDDTANDVTPVVLGAPGAAWDQNSQVLYVQVEGY